MKRELAKFKTVRDFHHVLQEHVLVAVATWSQNIGVHFSSLNDTPHGGPHYEHCITYLHIFGPLPETASTDTVPWSWSGYR